ncbi:hypothetical protein [Pseudomonas chlororaphis]|uniref:hypothetical protein n=1 Tax=Pseudomonas chlororaphis TaxID=587753 RepID=UPI001B342A8D|nr:hypothetical protein [Pseudomonas chlororaphis]MBP5143490.1 hypothetical protein [Pseudomonas chlororaphis]
MGAGIWLSLNRKVGESWLADFRAKQSQVIRAVIIDIPIKSQLEHASSAFLDEQAKAIDLYAGYRR